jgi:hypothetical protein
LSLGEGASPYRHIRDDRNMVNNLVWSSNNSPRTLCPVCFGARLTIQDAPDGKGKVGVCVKSCGQTYPLSTEQNQDTGVGTVYVPRYTSKYGSISKQHSFIISQKGKNKSKEELEKEAIEKELGRDGVTVVDSKEQYYEDGSWH